MGFWLIMSVGTLIALWAASASRASSEGQEDDEYSDEKQPSPPGAPFLNPPHLYSENGTRTPPPIPEVWQYQPMDQAEYWDALELHYKDPLRNPLPTDPPRPPREGFRD
ncbi:MAG: hypothetical protein JWN25_2104 [Verrucomicrobiales bacterium]|nr:hypothetical protein [Verrucomicrobiales bacterium]